MKQFYFTELKNIRDRQEVFFLFFHSKMTPRQCFYWWNELRSGRACIRFEKLKVDEEIKKNTKDDIQNP